MGFHITKFTAVLTFSKCACYPYDYILKIGFNIGFNIFQYRCIRRRHRSQESGFEIIGAHPFIDQSQYKFVFHITRASLLIGQFKIFDLHCLN